MSDSCANLHRVFSPELSEDKCWFAINSDLCCLKPSVFCSSASALLFQENYKKLKLVDVIDASGNPASSRWFNSHHRTEDVYVASAFGLLAGLLRGKNLEKCLFLKSNEFKRIVQAINKQGFSTKPQEHDDENGVVVSRLRNKGKILEDQLASTAKELIEIRAKLQDWVPPSPPSSPGEPKGQYNLYREPIPPKRKRAKSSALNLESIKNDKDLAPATKKRIAERASNVISHINDVCRSYGESFGTVLGVCCVLARKEDPHGARKAIKEAIDKMVKEKGASKAFSHLLSEEAWDSRVEIMRVPDWTSLLFKLKARLSDSAWVTMI